MGRVVLVAAVKSSHSVNAMRVMPEIELFPITLDGLLHFLRERKTVRAVLEPWLIG